ncbi:MAG: hypothetical protein DBY37_09175 [Desulfovibrionaceae bacterium]|nr:MAG: hypothetical protein DBY37_09175 [Desulfovibrionaceae bacterium]
MQREKGQGAVHQKFLALLKMLPESSEARLRRDAPPPVPLQFICGESSGGGVKPASRNTGFRPADIFESKTL